jgi:hypothetical protein
MLHYFDIAEIGKFLIAKLKNEETEMFNLFFQKVEEIPRREIQMFKI